MPLYNLPPELSQAVISGGHQWVEAYLARATDPEKRDMATLIGDLLRDRKATAEQVKRLIDSVDKVETALVNGIVKRTEQEARTIAENIMRSGTARDINKPRVVALCGVEEYEHPFFEETDLT